jgi:hypothetical protein
LAPGDVATLLGGGRLPLLQRLVLDVRLAPPVAGDGAGAATGQPQGGCGGAWEAAAEPGAVAEGQGPLVRRLVAELQAAGLRGLRGFRLAADPDVNNTPHETVVRGAVGACQLTCCLLP